MDIKRFAIENARAQFAGANDQGGYDNRAAAYNGAMDTLRVAAKHGNPITGVFVCRRKQGDFVVWPMVAGSQPPKSYKIVDEVFATRSLPRTVSNMWLNNV